MNYLLKLLKEFFTYEFVRSILLEVWKALITLCFAYISFRFFQNYKEKKQNNKVYIKMLKLEDSIDKNIKKIDEIIMLYKEGERLHSKLKLDEINQKYYYDIAEKIDNIINFYLVDESCTDFYNNVVESSSFYRRPMEYIRDLSYEIEDIQRHGSERELAIKECELEKFERMDIMNDLIDLMDVIIESDKDNRFNDILLLLEDFNKKDIATKEKMLDQFCKTILLNKEVVKKLRETYKKYNTLVDKLIENKKREQITIEFKEIDDKDEEFASYNAEFYFKVENWRSNLDKRAIFVNEKTTLEETKKELLNFKEELDKKIKEIKKKVDSTKLLFGN